MLRGLIVVLAFSSLVSVFGQGMIVRKGPGGGISAMGGGSAVHGLIFKLTQDEGWTDAKTQLLEKAAGGDRIEVIYHLERFKSSQSSNEVLQTRIDSVISGLEEAGHYPLTTDDVEDQVKALTKTLKKVGRSDTEGAITREVLYSLVQARKQVDRAHKIIDTGEIPADSKPRVRRVGGVIGQ